MRVCLFFLFLVGGIITAQGQGNEVLSADEQKSVTSGLQTPAEAADSVGWNKGGNFGLNVTQTYLSNWAAGGQSSVATTGLLGLFANYAKDNNSWDNTLDMAFGVLRQGEGGQWIKTDDRLDFSSKYGRRASKNWYYSALLNFRTQFAPGYNIVDGREVRTIGEGENEVDARISDFMSPGYSLFALGMDFKPNENFTAFIAPATVKTTYVFNQDLADQGAFGVEGATTDANGNIIEPGTGKNIRNELGGFIKMMYKRALMENVDFQTRVDLFSNYQNNPQNIDVNWEVLINMTINKYLQASITTQLLYDDDIDINRGTVTDAEGVEVPDLGPGTQFKQVLAIGFKYGF